MFDLGLFELLVIGLVALLVLGPEKLPRAARTAGMYVRRARQAWYSVRAEIERELAAEDFKRSIRDTRDALSDSATQIREGGQRIARSITGQLPPVDGDASSAAALEHDPDFDGPMSDHDRLDDGVSAAPEALPEPDPTGSASAESAAKDEQDQTPR